MNNLLRKLRSKRGASMIMAMVFMLFCAFVGGSVLVSATANAYRVAHLEEQQDFFLERSAALVLADELELERDQWFRLNVADAHKSIQEMVWEEGGRYTPTATPPRLEREITFQLTTNDTDITPLQRLQLETAVWRYLLENGISPSVPVKLEGFPDGMTSPSQFYFQVNIPDGEVVDYTVRGSMQISGSSASVELPDYTANFSSGRGIGELYDFTVDFGSMSQLKLSMNAQHGVNPPIQVVSRGADPTSSTGHSETTTTITQTSIAWENPVIEKGGAAS